jgi:hypothetical protein
MGLEAVELIVRLETAFGIEISDSEAFELQTPQKAIDLISAKVNASSETAGICPSTRAYHQIQTAFQKVLGCQPQQIQLDSKFIDFLPPKKQRQEAWKNLFDFMGMPETPKFQLGMGTIFRPNTIRELVDWAVARYPSYFIAPDERWTHSQVRCVVRAAIRDLVGESDFNDNSSFSDIGIV